MTLPYRKPSAAKARFKGNSCNTLFNRPACVRGKAWDYSEAGPTIRKSPEAQNTGQKPHHHHRAFSVLLTFILRDFREPSRKACPPKQVEREKKTKVLYVSSELASQNHTRSYSNRPTLNKRWQELQEELQEELHKSNGLEQLDSAIQIQWKLLKSLMARTSELKRPASHLAKISRAKPELSHLTPLALTEERVGNSITLVHNKKPEDLTWLLPQVFHFITASQKNFKGNLTWGKSR